MKNKPKALIFGASGFIGRHTVAMLSRNDWDVFAQCLPGEESALPQGVKWFSCDLRKGLCEDLLPPTCDTVIYLAQSPEFRNFPEGAESVFAINVEAVFRSIEYARKTGARRFIYASSGSVYDQNEVPCHESDLLDVTASRGFYAASKLATELLLRPYAGFMSIITLRLFMPYGPGLNPTMLLPEVVRRVRENIPIDLHGQDGMLINPIYIDDLTRTIGYCLNYEKTVTLNVGGAETLSLREISLCIGDVLGIPPLFNIKNEPSPVMVGDISALKREFGFSPKISMKEGISLWLKSTENGS